MAKSLTQAELKEYDIIRKIILKNVQFHTDSGYVGVNPEVVDLLRAHFSKEEK